MEQSEYRVHKHHRRMSSTGGGRAWTEEEEAYLLRSRMHKMPYKHIAAHLKKTELACRLHYHQMSCSNNGRRRSDSVSSTVSFASISVVGDTDNAYRTQLSPVVSTCSSPEPTSQTGMSPDSDFMQAHRAHVPILPKPDTNRIPLTLEPLTELDRPQGSDSLQSNSTYRYQREGQNYINSSRLLSIYDMHRESFWSKLAAEYSRNGAEISAKAAEETIMKSLSQVVTRTHLPPTPNLSPASSPEPQRYDFNSPVSSVSSRGFCAVNEPKPEAAAPTHLENTHRSLADRCSVSALLTVEKEVRPSHQ